MSAWALNSKTIALIDSICLHKKYYPRGSALLPDYPDWIWTREFLKGLFTIARYDKNMPSKYSKASNVCYNKKMRYDITGTS